MYAILALVLLVHGAAHVVAFLAPFGLLRGPAPARPALFDGRMEIGAVTGKVIGAGWIATAVAFFMASAAVWMHASWWLPYTAGVACVSLVLSALCCPESKAGVPLNLILLVFLVAAYHAGVP